MLSVYNLLAFVIIFNLQIELFVSGDRASRSSRVYNNSIGSIKFDDDEVDYSTMATRPPDTMTSMGLDEASLNSNDDVNHYLPVDCASKVKYFTQIDAMNDNNKVAASRYSTLFTAAGTNNKVQQQQQAVNSSIVNQKIGHRFALSDNEVPFIVKINIIDQFNHIKCAGTLIHPQWVITTSDCPILSFNLSPLVTVTTGRDFNHNGQLPSSSSSSSNQQFDRNGNLITIPSRPAAPATGRTTSDSFSRNVVRVLPFIDVTNDSSISASGFSCSPILLKLSSPFTVDQADTLCLADEGHTGSSAAEAKGIAVGWSTYGHSVVQEKSVRLTSVKISHHHCLMSDKVDSKTLCIKYNPQAHYYLLPGSSLITVHPTLKVASLYGLACGNLSNALVNSQYVYMQTYIPLYHYSSHIQQYFKQIYNIHNNSPPPAHKSSCTVSAFICLCIFLLLTT